MQWCSWKNAPLYFYSLSIYIFTSYSVESTTQSLAETMAGMTNDRVRQKLAQLFQTNKPHGDITTAMVHKIANMAIPLFSLLQSSLMCKTVNFP